MSKNKSKIEAPAPRPVEPTPRRVEPVVPAPFTPQRVERFRVAKGKSIAGARGILEEGTQVTIRDFGGEDKGGQASLDTLVERGYVEAYK